ncbi:single-stranded-DNA-specific exonuclease RecJ [Alicyclobacillus suci]|uniref:single-stranded-DNA-specific exonuclease RecJ n=1 Tax=Alicyclobacillus suci TaxID=2816080 RepID=UPI002E2D8F04|nr:single-stranded-DNA-specific exonuclease RecJ [Alicyclobacillus suci]
MSTQTPLWLTASVPEDLAMAIAKALDVPRRVARWLVARSINTPEEARRFLYAREQYSDPFDFKEMRQAVERIQTALAGGEHIVIVGDYDVDGVTASAILASELAAQGANWTCLIPERVADGYGLSEGLVERAAEQGACLIITVDNGIRAHEAIALALDLGMDVIVTDHHEPDDKTPLPMCSAVVHWSRHERPNDSIVLSGAGVAWKLCQAIEQVSRPKAKPSDHADWLRGLAALGAISDIMPMRGENRRLIREGLAALSLCRRPGWLALCERARVNLDELTATGVAWRIAPRMNAAGRMASAMVAFDLLMSHNRAEAVELADALEQLNTTRKKVTESAVEEAKAQVEAHSPDGRPSGIVVAGPWPLGVVGIVAAKLVDHYNCPAIVLADAGEPVLRGSGRAPSGFSLHDALAACSSLLHHFGGHDAAVGCGVSRTQVDAFREAFAAVVEAAPHANGHTEDMVADDFLPLEEVTLETLEWTSRFAPHGPENNPLRFFIGPAIVKSVASLGDGSHLRLRLQEGKSEADVVWFQAPDGAKSDIASGDLVAVVVELEENVWRGNRRIQLRAVQGWRLKDPVLRDVFAVFYRHLLKTRVVSRDVFATLIPDQTEANVEVILATFVELGFAECHNGTYHVVEAAGPRDLREALAYQAHLRTHFVPF